LKAEDACVCLVLQASDAALGKVPPNVDMHGLRSIVGRQDGDTGASEAHARSTAVVVRRKACATTVEVRASGRMLGKPVDVTGSCSLRIEYTDGCLAVYSVPNAPGNPEEVCVGSTPEVLVIESMDLGALLAEDEATVCVYAAESQSDACVLTHLDICAPRTHPGILSAGVGSAADRSNNFATEGEALTKLLSELGTGAQIEGVREELEGAKWQRVLWEMCWDDRMCTEARQQALRLAVDSLLDGKRQVCAVPVTCSERQVQRDSCVPVTCSSMHMLRTSVFFRAFW
jgi:hypothetical protein